MSNNNKSWVYTPRKITIARGIGYGLGDLMGGGWGNILASVVFVFLTFQGISPTVAGATTGIGRLVDAVMALFIGGLSDNFYRTKLGKKFGRRHFFIITGTILFAILFPLFWLPVGSPVYYLVIYIAIEFAISLYLITWETLPNEMTEEYNLRTVLSGSRMVISAIGTSMVFFVIFVLKTFMPNSPNAYAITGLIWTVIFVAGMLISWRSTWERELTDEFIKELESKPRESFGQTFSKNIKNYAGAFRVKAFRKHLAVYLFSYTGKDFFGFALPFFVIYSLFLTESDSWMIQALAFVGIFSALLAAKLMISKGPKFLFTLSYTSIIVMLFAFVGVYLTVQYDILTPKQIIPLVIVLAVVWHIGRAILEFTAWNVFPFIPDVDYIMTREHNAGAFAAIMTFFRKSTAALAVTIGGWVLEHIVGFKSPKKGSTAAEISAYAHSLSEGVQHGITATFFIGTIGLIAIALIFAQTFRLNKKSHGILVEEIHRLENGGSKADVSAEAKQVVEALTGHPYSECWPEK